MNWLYVDWHFQERKDILWCGLPSKDGKRVLYSIPICEVYSSEFSGKDLMARGRFKHFVHQPQQYRITIDKEELKQRWPRREEFFHQMGIVMAWTAENCRDEPWSMEGTVDVLAEEVSLHFSFANEIAAVAFKFVWQ